MVVSCIGCAEPECPDGYEKVGKVCRRPDAGALGTDAATWIDPASVRDASDAAESKADARPQERPTDATVPIADAITDAAAFAPDDATPPECSSTRPCTAAGYNCSAGKCESGCITTRCDLNATCALSGGTPQCTCNRGYLPVTDAQGLLTCVQDVACAALGCDVNAPCQLDENQIKRCVCKIGYTGTGKSCTPVSCPLLTIEHGSVSPTGTISFGGSASYKCDAGYELKLSGVVASVTRKCDELGKWSAADARCDPVNCEALIEPAHGELTYTRGTVYQGKAEYSCDSGYRITSELDRTRTCQVTGKWSGSEPRCLGCGDTIISPTIGEECDPKATNWSIWTCDPSSCKKRSIYAPCGSSSDCNATLNELCYNNSCTTSCVNGEACPATPSGSIPAGRCAGPVCIATGCRTAADCAPGLVCPGSLCVACSDVSPCASGQQCQGGRCRTLP